MAFFKCSFTRIVLLVFVFFLSYYVYSMFLIFNPNQCSSKVRGSCLPPAYPSHQPLEVRPPRLTSDLVHLSLQLWVYVSEKQLVQKEKMELVWREKSLLRNTTVTKYTPANDYDIISFLSPAP